MNELQLTCKTWQVDFENPALYKWLTLDEEKILHVKRSHEENDESIEKEILRWSTDTKYLKLKNFRHYFNKILLMMIEHSTGKVFKLTFLKSYGFLQRKIILKHPLQT